MTTEEIIKILERRSFELSESEKIRLLMVVFQLPSHMTTLEFMKLERLLKEFSL